MDLAERIARIERILIAEGKLDPDPSPTYEQAVRDFKSGDDSTLKAFFLREIKQGRMK